jgi:hypothetical protein
MQDTPTFHLLDALIRQICGLPEVERFGALFSACRCLGGTVIQPGSASHMFEISVLGVYAGAADRHELVLNWLRGARALRGASADVADQPLQSVAIEHNPARRGIQLAAATDMIARPDRHDDDHLISACRIILANSRDHSERERACQLAAALGHGTPGKRSA